MCRGPGFLFKLSISAIFWRLPISNLPISQILLRLNLNAQGGSCPPSPEELNRPSPPLLLLYKSSGCPVILSPRSARLSCKHSALMVVAVGPRINCVKDRLELGAPHCRSDRQPDLDALEQAAHLG